MRIIHLAIKDFYQILLDWKSFLFLLAMPIAFTLLFGFAFQDAGGKVDNRLPVVLLDRDESTYSEKITGMLEDSDVIRVADVENSR